MKKFELEIIDQAVKALGNLPDTIRECNGWRLQQNEFTRHCRLVDPENIRRAWGTKNAMVKALRDINNRISTL